MIERACESCGRIFVIASPTTKKGKKPRFCSDKCRISTYAHSKVRNPSLKEIRDLLEYFPETGVFLWKIDRQNAKIGTRAGYIVAKGYRVISVKLKRYYAHRLAWLYMTGKWPQEQIDHKNMMKDDNRFENLRHATGGQNLANSITRASSGFKGVKYFKRDHVWAAYIGHNNKKYYLGRFPTPEEAHRAYCIAAEKFHGEFARTS